MEDSARPVLEYHKPVAAEQSRRIKRVSFWITLPGVAVPFVWFVRSVTPLQLAMVAVVQTSQWSLGWSSAGRGLLGALFFLWPVQSIWRLRVLRAACVSRAECVATWTIGAIATGAVALMLGLAFSQTWGGKEMPVILVGFGTFLLGAVLFALIATRRADPITLATAALLVPLTGHAGFSLAAGLTERPSIGCFILLATASFAMAELIWFTVRSLRGTTVRGTGA